MIANNVYKIDLRFTNKTGQNTLHFPVKTGAWCQKHIVRSNPQSCCIVYKSDFPSRWQNDRLVVNEPWIKSRTLFVANTPQLNGNAQFRRFVETPERLSVEKKILCEWVWFLLPIRLPVVIFFRALLHEMPFVKVARKKQQQTITLHSCTFSVTNLTVNSSSTSSTQGIVESVTVQDFYRNLLTVEFSLFLLWLISWPLIFKIKPCFRSYC